MQHHFPYTQQTLPMPRSKTGRYKSSIVAVMFERKSFRDEVLNLCTTAALIAKFCDSLLFFIYVLYSFIVMVYCLSTRVTISLSKLFASLITETVGTFIVFILSIFVISCAESLITYSKAHDCRF